MGIWSQLKFSRCSQLGSETVKMKTLNSIIVLVIFFNVSILDKAASAPSTYNLQLSTAGIESAFNSWNLGDLQYNFLIQGFLQSSREEKFRRYKNIIGKIVDDFSLRTYESDMNKILNGEKKTAIDEFKSECSRIVDQSKVTSYADSLGSDIDSFNSNLTTEKMKTYNGECQITKKLIYQHNLFPRAKNDWNLGALEWK